MLKKKKIPLKTIKIVKTPVETWNFFFKMYQARNLNTE